MNRRVVVTGMGMVSPLGNDLTTSWDGIVHGRSGIAPIVQIDASKFPTQIAGEIKGFDPMKFVSVKDAKKMDSFIYYGIGAAFMALDDAGLEINEINAERVGALIGSGIGGVFGIEEQTIKLYEGAHARYLLSMCQRRSSTCCQDS